MDATDRNLCEHNTAMTRPHISLRRASHRAKGRLGKQSGVALVTALLMLFVLSLVVTAMITTSQQEMWTNANFRATTQARYVAEGGAQAAIYYLKNTWTLPATSSFTLTSYPITFSSNNSNIVMASSNFGNLSDTYSSFDSAGDAAFDAKISSFQTTLQGSISTAKIAVAAQLLYVNTSTNLTRWRITSRGSVGNAGSSGASGGVGSGLAQVEEIVEFAPGSSTLLPVPFKGFNYGGFATGAGCNSIYMSGGSSTNAYSYGASASKTSPSMLNTGGSMATFGSATLIGSAYIMGNLYAPGYAKFDATQGSNSIKLPGVTGYAPNGKSYNNNDGCQASQSPLYAEWISQSNSSGVDCTSASTSSCSNDPQPLPSAYTSTT